MLLAVRVTPGTGKTRFAEAQALRAVERGKRAAITFPTHEVARGTVDRLRAAGARVKYRMAVHRVIDASTGAPLCKLPVQAAAIAASGLSVQRELCHGLGSQPCPHAKECQALRLGADSASDDEAAVWVGPHALMMEAADHARDGLLVVDEPPPPVHVDRVSLDDLVAAHEAASNFVDGHDLRLVLSALAAGLAAGAGDAREALELGADDAVGTSKIARQRVAAYPGETRGRKLAAMFRHAAPHGVPRLSSSGLARAGGGEPVAAVRTVAAIATALDPPGSTLVKVVDGREDEGPVLGVCGLAHEIRHAIDRAQNVLLLDATVDPALQIVLFRKLDVVSDAVGDGAPVERVVVESRSATRSGWLAHGRANAKNIVGPLRRALAVVCEDPARVALGVVTFAGLQPEIEAAWRGDGELAALFELWRRRGGSVGFMHYGNVRSRNDFEGCDAVLTLGDPFPNVDTHRLRCEVAGLNFDEDYVRACRDELTQACGRIRAPRRTRPGLLVHVGGVLPGDWEEETMEIRRVEAPDPGQPEAADDPSWKLLAYLVEAMPLTRNEAADVMGVSTKTVQRRMPDGG